MIQPQFHVTDLRLKTSFFLFLFSNKPTHAITISDTEKIDQNYSEIQKDNLELRGIVDNLSRQLRDLEKRINV